MGETDDEHRESGVEFGDLADHLAAHEYPASLAALVDAYGDETLDLHGDDVTFRELMQPLLESGEETTYGDAEEVRQDVLNFVGDDAIGREGYSDRGGSLPEETEESEEVQEDDEDQSF